MHNLLYPEDDGFGGGAEFLVPSEVIERIKNEFGYVAVDKENGRQEVLGRIAFLRKTKETGRFCYGIDIDEVNEAIRSLEKIQEEVYDVTFADDPEFGKAFINIAIYPDREIFVGYESGEQQEESALLLDRLAKVLGYEIEEG